MREYSPEVIEFAMELHKEECGCTSIAVDGPWLQYAEHRLGLLGRVPNGERLEQPVEAEFDEEGNVVSFNAQGKLGVTLDKFLEEMVQVGAVANVIVEDHGTPDTDGRYTPLVQKLVADERRRQIEKWGPQHETPLVWMVILMEEVGEAADELNLADAEDNELLKLIQDIGALGARSKAYLKARYGW